MVYQNIIKNAKWLRNKLGKTRKRLKNVLTGKPEIETKSQIINWLAKNYNYNSYLEISTLHSGFCFDQIDENLFTTKDCLNYYSEEFPREVYEKVKFKKDHKIPFMEYDEHLERIRNSHGFFDVILVDSYHTFAQTKKDIETAMQLVSNDGVIVVHDCNPPDVSMIVEARPSIESSWCGKTYQYFIDFRINNPQLEISVVDIDLGCGIIRKNYPAFNSLVLNDNLLLSDVTKWEYFSENRKELLNLISVDEFIEHYKKN